MRIVDGKNKIKYIKSDILPCLNAFSTRVGGVSLEEHTSSLNLAFGRGDDDATVLRNLRIFGEGVGFDAEKVISVPQIHSNTVAYVGKSNAGEGYFQPTAMRCDGYVTDQKGIVLGVKTADCVPILMAATDDGGIPFAVAAVHAGWRGSVKKIAAEAVRQLCQYGASPENIRVAVGPCICGKCYEVGDDFCKTVLDLLGEDMMGKFIVRDPDNGRKFADLKALNLEILIECGVREENIDVCELCTCERNDLFYSHRGMSGKRGTMLSVISL